MGTTEVALTVPSRTITHRKVTRTHILANVDTKHVKDLGATNKD